MATSDIFMMNSNMVDPMPSPSKKKLHGSVKSTKSLGGISIFQDPEAGSTLPRDVEMTLTMYDQHIDENRMSSTASDNGMTSSKRNSGSSQQSSSIVSGSNISNGDSVINGEKSTNSKDKKGDKNAYTFTYSQTVSESSTVNRESGSGSTTLPNKKKTNPVVKTGSFQMKSAYDYAPVSRTSSITSGQPEAKNKSLSGGSFSMNTGVTSTAMRSDSGIGASKQNGYNNDQKVIRTITTDHYSSKTSVGKESTGYGSVNGLNQASKTESTSKHEEKGPDTKLERRDSDLTNVSSLTSYSVAESYQRKSDNKPIDVSDKKLTTGAGQVSTPLLSVSRSDSQKSEAKTISKAPSLSSMTEYNKRIITDVYNDDINETEKGEGVYNLQSSYSDNTGKLAPKSAESTLESTKGGKKIISHTKITTTSNVSTSKDNENKSVSGSQNASMVQNKDFRDKMSALFKSQSKSKIETNSNSISSSASSTMARGPEKTFKNDVHLEIKSDVNKTSVENNEYGSTFPRMHTHDSVDNTPISPEPVSPVKEMKETIKFGTVGSLVKDKFKNLNLTGRSVDPSTIERQKSKPSIASPDAETQSGEQSKKYKFLIEGIDYPETELPVDSVASETTDGELSAGSPDDGTLSPSNTKKRNLTKKGFSYVLDEKLASAIIKKAEDVHARKAHEALDAKDTQKKDIEDSEVLVEAKAKLKHEESFTGSKNNYKARTPMENALLKDIRSRLVRPQSTVSDAKTSHDDKVEKHEKEIPKTPQEEVIKTTTTIIKHDDTDVNTSANTQQESIMSSVTTIDSTITTTSQATDVTSQDEIPLSENKLVYDGYKYEIMNKGTSEKDQPKSYSQVFKAEAVGPKTSSKSETSKKKVATDLQFEKSETAVDYFDKRNVPGKVTVKYSPELSSKNEHFSQHKQPSNSHSKTIHTNETVITTEVKSLRDMNKYNKSSHGSVISNTVITPTEYELKSEDSSSTSSVIVQPVYTSQNNFDTVPTSNRSSISSDSTLSQQYDIDHEFHNGNIVEEEIVVPHKKKIKDELNIIITDDTTRNSDIQNYTEYEHMMDGYSQSVGTNVKTPLNMSPSRHVSHNDLLDEDTKESYKHRVTSERPIKTSGRHASELYIEVNGGKHGVYEQQQGGILSVNTSNRRDQEVFYTGGHLLQQSDDVTVQRVGNKGGQLYTTVYKKNKQHSPGLRGYEDPKSPKGGILLVKQSPHTSGLPSPKYPGSESTHNSTSSGAVSSPEFREDLFYQPSRSQVNQWNNVSRSSSSVTGSVQSHRSDGVYVYRTDTRHGRNLSDLGNKAIHLKPLKAGKNANRELKTHPTAYNSHNTSMMSSPVVMSDFETNMNGTSTLRPNTDTGFIHVIDSSSMNNVKVQRDENMNYTSPPISPNRMLTVDEVSRGRIPVRRSMKISTINIEGDDAFSGISDPTFSRNNKYRVQKVMDVRRMNNEYATPVDMHPDTAYKKQKFYSVQRTASSPQKPPEVEVELEPHLQEAHKKGNNYNVTMKLNASVLGLKSGSRSEDMFREEYVEESLYKNSNSMRGPPPQFSPRGQSSMSVSDDSVIVSPGSRSKTNITLIENYQTSQSPNVTSNNVEHMQFKQYVNPPPQISVTRASSTLNEAYLRPSNNNAPQRSPNINNNTGNAPKFSMCIDQTMTMDYVPTDENDNTNRQQANEPLLQRQNVPKNRMPPKQRRHKQPVMERTTMMVNGDAYENNSYYEDDDLEQYFSPAEEEPIRPKRAPSDENDYGYPQVVRGSILIKNAIDTTGAPKVVDVVEGDTESEDDDALIHDNVNPFHGMYFQARENPMYSSDPDLRAAMLREQQMKPQFTKLFEQQQKSSSRGKGGRMNSFENEDYDTEIKVTRVSNERAAGPAKKKKTTKSENTYVYNGYDQTDRGSSSNARGSSSNARGSSSANGRTAISSNEMSTEYHIQRLLQNAPAGSIKQTINVEREEEEILGPLPNGDDGTGPDSLLNFDTISEKVDLGMKEGGAQVAVKVRCERIVPIRGVEDMFKKSSVIVTRLIEIDLMVTDERKRLYEHITNKSRNMITSGDGNSRSSNRSSQQKLSTKDTFKLYKTFMGMAEADEHGKSMDNLRIDRKIEETNRPEVQARANLFDMDIEENGAFEHDTEALDRQLEEQLIAHAMRPPEPDTISYLSAASEAVGDILY